MNNGLIYFIQILFVSGIAIGSQTLNLEDKLKWLNVARYAVYILTIVAVPEICKLLHQLASKQISLAGALQHACVARGHVLIYVSCAGALVLGEQRVFTHEFLFVFLGYLLVQYPEMSQAGARGCSASSINYGVGMACSFFEGYLVHIIPSDGARFVGFEENMRALEDQEGVLFPVKKIFLVITKSLYSPPDLKEFNRGTDVPHMEAFNCLADVKKSVAGVKDRIYHNTAYKIYRGRGHTAPPVCLAAECATPLHTLYRVLSKRELYDEIAEIDVEQVKSDFCRTLQSILNKSPECRGKCELIYYDHEDPTQNLSEILLKRIKELAPDYEERIIERREQNKREN